MTWGSENLALTTDLWLNFDFTLFNLIDLISLPSQKIKYCLFKNDKGVISEETELQKVTKCCYHVNICLQTTDMLKCCINCLSCSFMLWQCCALSLVRIIHENHSGLGKDLSQNMLVSFMKRWLGSPGSITTNTAVYCLSVLSKISRRFHINKLLRTNSGFQLNVIWNIGVKHAHLHISLDCRKVKCKFNLNFLYGN